LVITNSAPGFLRKQFITIYKGASRRQKVDKKNQKKLFFVNIFKFSLIRLRFIFAAIRKSIKKAYSVQGLVSGFPFSRE
jgi:hypothetical protein